MLRLHGMCQRMGGRTLALGMLFSREIPSAMVDAPSSTPATGFMASPITPFPKLASVKLSRVREDKPSRAT